jgi:predicted O-linked N-acetylglucosamine transferase (SPINDLY family)
MDNFEEAKSYFLKGLSALETKDFMEAEAFFISSLALLPHRVSTLTNLSAAQLNLQKYADCIESSIKAIEIEEENYEAWLNLAQAQYKTKNQDAALAALDRLIALQPGNVTTYITKGCVYSAFNWIDEAIEAYNEAIELDDSSSEAYFNKGLLLKQLRRYSETLSSFEKAYLVDPDAEYLVGYLFHLKMLTCDWSEYLQLLQKIEQKLQNFERAIDPFSYQGISNSEQMLQICTQLYAEHLHPKKPQLTLPQNIQPKAVLEPIHLGYLSGEFRHQATSLLLVELLEMHDKQKFEIFIFDNGKDDQSEVRKRINQAVHHVVPIGHLSDEAAAQEVQRCQIDILLNLNGYFGKGRQQVFALKPAPIQINYLGFPGTLGCSYMDYIVADPVVIPFGSEAHYNEKIIRLPQTYQPNDSKKETATRLNDRSFFNLPEDAFVYCSFNNSYKITPEVFSIWCGILQSVENSVLWILVDNPDAETNLADAFLKNGLARERLIFTSRMPLKEHLSRHLHANLFLDTLPCNAHTTCSDALWAGLPVITCKGHTFSGRVASSLLKAAKLDELITTSLEDYKKLAIELGRNPVLLANIKVKMQNIRDAPLFNTRMYTQKLETAFEQVFQRYQAGLEPESLYIE